MGAMNDQAPPRSKGAGKIVAFAAPLALIIAMAGIGYHHATRNRIRHAPGSLSGKQLYELYCDRCHGPDLKGDQNYPSLVARPFTLEEVTRLTRDGGERMPKFPFLDAIDLQRLHEYLGERRAAAQ